MAMCFFLTPAIILSGFFVWVAIKMLLQKNNSAIALGILFGVIAWCYPWLAVAYQRTTVTVKNDRGKVFTGLWPIGFSQQFDWDKVASISLRRTSFGNRLGLCVAIKESRGERYVLFAFRANLDKQKFIVRQLQKLRTEYVAGRSDAQKQS